MRKAGISLLTVATILVGTLGGVPMKAKAATYYGLSVGGCSFSSECLVLDDTVSALFSGTATFDPASHTLTLTNFSNGGRTSHPEGLEKCFGIYYNGSNDLTIRLEGRNVITLTADAADACYVREGFYSQNRVANVTIQGTTFSDSLTLETGENTATDIATHRHSDCTGIDMTGSLLIKDCSVNSLAGDSKNGSSGFLLWNDSGFSSGSLTIDHACVTARGGNLTNRLGSDSGNYGINCTYNTVTICNGSIVTASSGTVTNNESYSSGIFANDGLYILNSKVDASSYKAAIYGSVRNDVPGQGWTDVAGTQGLAQIPVSDLNGAGQNLSAYKKIHIAGSYTATVTNGTGGGTYELGDTVNITANAPTGKKLFNGWTSNAGVSFANANSASTSFVMPAQAVTVTANYVDMPAATLTQAPTAKTGLIANGSAQELINGGSATGGDLKYAIGNESAPTSNYGTAIPTGTNAGTYYVWYMVSGDSNHSDTTPAKVTVTISPKDEGDTPDDGDGQDGDTPDDGDGQDDDDTPDDGMSETEQLIRAFVARMYTQALGREAEAAGLDDWSA